MTQLLEQLGFKDKNGVYLPMLSEFEKAIDNYDTMTIEGLSNYYEHNHWYRLFITQPLTKGMFIPCDEDGNVLEEPNGNWIKVNRDEYLKLKEQYQQAKERVLFKHNEGIDYEGNKCYFFMTSDEINTIEQAINNGVKLYLK